MARTRRNPQITISQESKETLRSLSDELNLSLSEVVELLISNYKKKQSFNTAIKHYDESEKEEINRAIKNSRLSLEEITKQGILQRSRYLNSIVNNQSELESMSIEELKKATFKGVARYRILEIIEKIKKHNNNKKNKQDKICLTKGVVFKLTGSNRSNINRIFDEFEKDIKTHNKKHGLTDLDNRKGKAFCFEELLGVEK